METSKLAQLHAKVTDDIAGLLQSPPSVENRLERIERLLLQLSTQLDTVLTFVTPVIPSTANTPNPPLFTDQTHNSQPHARADTAEDVFHPIIHQQSSRPQQYEKPHCYLPELDDLAKRATIAIANLSPRKPKSSLDPFPLPIIDIVTNHSVDIHDVEGAQTTITSDSTDDAPPTPPADAPPLTPTKGSSPTLEDVCESVWSPSCKIGCPAHVSLPSNSPRAQSTPPASPSLLRRPLPLKPMRVPVITTAPDLPHSTPPVSTPPSEADSDELEWSHGMLKRSNDPYSEVEASNAGWNYASEPSRPVDDSASASTATPAIAITPLPLNPLLSLGSSSDSSPVAPALAPSTASRNSPPPAPALRATILNNSIISSPPSSIHPDSLLPKPTIPIAPLIIVAPAPKHAAVQMTTGWIPMSTKGTTRSFGGRSPLPPTSEPDLDNLNKSTPRSRSGSLAGSVAGAISTATGAVLGGRADKGGANAVGNLKPLPQHLVVKDSPPRLFSGSSRRAGGHSGPFGGSGGSGGSGRGIGASLMTAASAPPSSAPAQRAVPPSSTRMRVRTRTNSPGGSDAGGRKAMDPIQEWVRNTMEATEGETEFEG